MTSCEDSDDEISDVDDAIPGVLTMLLQVRNIVEVESRMSFRGESMTYLRDSDNQCCRWCHSVMSTTLLEVRSSGRR